MKNIYLFLIALLVLPGMVQANTGKDGSSIKDMAIQSEEETHHKLPVVDEDILNNPAVIFVHELTDHVIENVLTSQKSKEEKLTEFRKDFTRALDLKSIGQFVLGIYWRTASEAERKEFLDIFVEFTTKSWADKFDMYQGQTILFTGVRESDKRKVYVDSQIQNNPPVEVIWRLRQKKGQYHIVDIIIEGVSMAMSYRNEYGSFLQAHNGQVSDLIMELKEKNKNFKFSEQTPVKS